MFSYVKQSSWNFVLEKTVNTFKLEYFSKYVNHWESGVKRGQPHALQLKRDWYCKSLQMPQYV